LNLSDNITVLKNLGEARAKAFARADVSTVEDLLNFLPRDYEDRSVISSIKDMEAGLPYTIKARVALTPKNNGFRGIVTTVAILEDESGRIEAVWFNQPYMKATLSKGEIYFFSGKIIQKGDKLQFHAADFEKPKEDSTNTGRIIPIYTSSLKLSQKLIRGYIKEALDNCVQEIPEILPEKIINEYNIMPRREALFNIHFPKFRDAFLQARKRLVFEEFFIFQLTLLAIKGNIKKEKTAVNICCADYEELKLPFGLTSAQEKTLASIKADISCGSPMYRLVQGDVGSGKTIVALISAYWAIKNGYQAAIMAPTEVLAGQHLESFEKLFTPLGITCALVTGSMKAAEKKAAHALISSGEAQMIIGTHALIQAKIQYNNLGLVITDEQHRFGVKQRAKFSDKGENPHVLVMSATPIPRSLALVLYGDMDVSVINELPPGRQPIDTFAVDTSYRQRVYKFIDKELEAGRQAYIICPSIEDGGKLEIQNVMEYATLVKNEFLKSHTIGILHGKMKPAEKQLVMDRFYAGEISVIVSTTVIEVGVNVANATVMVIENADRFGLSQLHQLRGRVGRGSHKSYCVLFSDAKGEVAKERLAAMTKTSDGFEISELDLNLRGPGDFFGTRQHGLPEFKIGNILKDNETLTDARKAAADFLENKAAYSKKEQEILNNYSEKFINYAGRGF